MIVPTLVRNAVDRMCTPLDPTRLTGVTAIEDARCMAIIKGFIDGLDAPAPLGPNATIQRRVTLARNLYAATLDDSIHCNRYPAFEELDRRTKDGWLAKADAEMARYAR